MTSAFVLPTQQPLRVAPISIVAAITRQYPTATRLYSSQDENDDSETNPSQQQDDQDKEETLLRLNLSVLDSSNDEEALFAVQNFLQSFPFAVVLPVQPMNYFPTLEGGVDLLFMRKKTQEKGSIDGGVKIYITPTLDGTTIEVVMKRNSNGQTVSKQFSEKLIVQALVKAFGGGEDADDRIPPAPLHLVTVDSVFYPWLDQNETAER